MSADRAWKRGHTGPREGGGQKPCEILFSGKPVFWAFPECDIYKSMAGRNLMILAGLSLFEEVPGHPRRRIRRQLAGVPLELGEIVERIGARELTGVDQAHE